MKRFLCAAMILVTVLMPMCAAAQPSETMPEDIAVAREVYSWFVMSPLAVDPDQPSPDGDMFLLADQALSESAEMQRRMNACFSTEISQSLWAWGAYQNIDGLLYGFKAEDRPYARETDPRIETIVYKTVSQTDKKRTYTAVVYYAGGGESAFQFVSEYVTDRWIFTTFPFIW